MFLKAITAFLFWPASFSPASVFNFIALGYEAEGWTKVEGEVVSVGVKVDVSLPVQTQGTRSTTAVRRYYPLITYSWKVGDQTFTGSRYRLGETHEKFKDKSDAIAAATKYRNGMPIPVYYNAERPSRAVLDPSLSWAFSYPSLSACSSWRQPGPCASSAPALEKAMAASNATQTTRP